MREKPSNHHASPCRPWRDSAALVDCSVAKSTYFESLGYRTYFFRTSMRSLSLRISGTLLATILICIGTTTAQETSAQVWANSRSHVHCPGSPFYGNTKSGRYMTEAKAVTSGYRAAGGMTCTGGTAVPPNQGTHIAECGIERWPVKILADHDHAKVNLTPVDTTVHELCSRKPAIPL